MPFERYLSAPPTRDNTASENGPAFEDLPRSGQDIGYDQSIFSTNVQFQVPQLMLGPTLPPGGGAEALPAGIVGNPLSVASSWLADSVIPKYSYDYWPSPSPRSLPESQPFASLPFYTSVDALTAPSLNRSSLSLPHACPPGTCADYSVPEPQQQHANAIGTQSTQSTSSPVSFPLSVPVMGGLPVYSTSGFDLLSVLARVVTRPNPKIVLGPVDMTCSFVVVDVRRFDSPIVYASPTFLKLTGYSEQEIIGRNCRFLQSPDGNVQRGEQRRHTAHEAVSHMRKSLSADKECQVSLINYRKGGTPFVNLVTVIPVRGGAQNLPEEAEEVAYQVGFQVDLTEQPSAILQKLRDGSYMVNYSNNAVVPPEGPRDSWKATSPHTPGVSKLLRAILNNPQFLESIPLSTSTTTLSITPAERGEPHDSYDGNRPLSLLLLETSPDFVQVLSLKGAFLYISPSVRRVLGYEAEELVGQSITDYCHEADKIPLVRELKDSSALPMPASNLSSLALDGQGTSQNVSSSGPRVVDLLFRMRVKDSSYVWVECRGRLHVEPGKGRKAIILSGRVRSMPSLTWGPLARAGGLVPSAVTSTGSNDGSGIGLQERELEFWALLSIGGSFLFVATAVRDVLGWGPGEVIGRYLGDFIGGPDPVQGRAVVEGTLKSAFADTASESRNLSCELKKKDGSQISVDLIFYQPPKEKPTSVSTSLPRPLICQVKVPLGPSIPSSPVQLVHLHGDEVFDDFDVTRGSSWQYELQQLKFANQRLREEVESLEVQIRQEEEAETRRRALRRQDISNPVFGRAWTNSSYDGRTSSKRGLCGDMIT